MNGEHKKEDFMNKELSTVIFQASAHASPGQDNEYQS